MAFNWIDKSPEFWGALSSGKTPKEFQSFCRELKNYIRKMDFDEVKGFTANHFCTSGFVRRGDRIIYVSISDVRYRSTGDYREDVLYRTAKSFDDYRGGMNRRCRLDQLERALNDLFDNNAAWQGELMSNW